MRGPVRLSPRVIAVAAVCASAAIVATVILSGVVSYEPLKSRRAFAGLCQLLFAIAGMLVLFLRQAYLRIRYGPRKHADWLVDNDEQSPFWPGLLYFSAIMLLSAFVHLF